MHDGFAGGWRDLQFLADFLPIECTLPGTQVDHAVRFAIGVEEVDHEGRLFIDIVALPQLP